MLLRDRTLSLHYLQLLWAASQLGSARRRDLFLRILEDARKKYRFVVVGYVAMPEHFHLLMSEPQVGDPSKAMQVIKQRFAQRILRRQAREQRQGCLWDTPSQHVWRPRFYDFNVWTERKRIEKLRYMHRNPVKRGLVLEPKQWAWSSFRWYRYGEKGLVAVNDTSVMKMRLRNQEVSSPSAPAPCKNRKERGTP
jgi:putative transposase